MELQVYPCPHVGRGTTRLLLESTIGDASQNLHETYVCLYLWVDASSRLTGAQVVVGESLACTIGPDGAARFGRVSRTPMNRALTGVVTDEDREALVSVAGELSCAAFPRVVSWVADAVHGMVPGPCVLSDQESEAVKKLMPSATGGL